MKIRPALPLDAPFWEDDDAEGIICSIFHLKSARRDGSGVWQAQFFGGTYTPLRNLVARLMGAIFDGDETALREVVDMCDPTEKVATSPDAPDVRGGWTADYETDHAIAHQIGVTDSRCATCAVPMPPDALRRDIERLCVSWQTAVPVDILRATLEYHALPKGADRE